MGASPIRFEVPGEAVPWKAARVVRRGARHVGISPDDMKDAQATVQHHAWMAMQAAGMEPLQGPVELHLTI